MGTFQFSVRWHALGREAELASEQLAAGVTALGRANHAQRGYYSQAFFGMSIGFERAAKLIIIADHAIREHGSFPTNQELKSVGHNIEALFAKCQSISLQFREGKDFWQKPDEPVHRGITETLSEFAVLTRYYNLDLMSGRDVISTKEPISAWWSRVAAPILSNHYSERMRARDEAERAHIAAIGRDSMSVLHHSEDEQVINNIERLVTHGAATRVVQKYGRLYCLQLVRWLSFLIGDLSQIGAYERRIELLFGLDEPFYIFRNNDDLLLRRKTWSIYRP